MRTASNLAAVAGLVSLLGKSAALPINANGTAASPPGDVDVLNFALILEYLELNLYETVVTSFTDEQFTSAGFPANTRATFNQIISQEQTHIATLQQGVRQNGGQVIQPCRYDYGNFTTPGQLLNITDAVNGLGPSAYVGAGAYIQSKLVLTQGSAIGNIESRHNSWLNGVIGRSEQPATFQLPLNPTQAYGVGSQFIVSGSCPEGNSALMGAITAYPPGLTVTNPGYPAQPLEAGASLLLQPGQNVTAPRAAFLYGFNTTIVPFENGQATIPADAAGQAYVVLTTATQGQVLNDANSLTAPAAFYVDVPAQTFANANYTTYDFLPGAATGNSNSTQ